MQKLIVIGLVVASAAVAFVVGRSGASPAGSRPSSPATATTARSTPTASVPAMPSVRSTEATAEARRESAATPPDLGTRQPLLDAMQNEPADRTAAVAMYRAALEVGGPAQGTLLQDARARLDTLLSSDAGSTGLVELSCYLEGCLVRVRSDSEGSLRDFSHRAISSQDAWPGPSLEMSPEIAASGQADGVFVLMTPES